MDQITRDHIQYGATIIDYDIEFVPRKTLSICVNPDTTVCLKAPVGATMEQIQQKVHKRAGWILKQKRFFESFGTPTTKRQLLVENRSIFGTPVYAQDKGKQCECSPLSEQYH